MNWPISHRQMNWPISHRPIMTLLLHLNVRASPAPRQPPPPTPLMDPLQQQGQLLGGPL